MLKEKRFFYDSLKLIGAKNIFAVHAKYYRKYPNLVRIQVEIISDPNYLMCILFERSFSRHLI